ncbi:MAG: two-component histidine kinase [Gemmatimonadetes bacterium]|nr:two-component histidine kinase [Gemmatimonadota bacterium]
MRLASVRARLALWNTAVLALLLVLLAAGAYAFVLETSRARTDSVVRDAMTDLQYQLVAERPQHATTREAAQEVLQELQFRHITFFVYDSAGALVASSLPRARASRHEPPEAAFDATRLGRLIAADWPTRSRAVSLPDPEGGYRAVTIGVQMPDGRFVVGAAASLHEEEETLAAARLAMLVTIPVALLLASLGGWLLARRSLQPMIIMREHAARIGASNLSDRLPVSNPGDEVGQLAAVINDLLARLELAFARQRQFMEDASHELRTPVAVIQHEASLALSRPGRNAGEYEEALTIVRDAGRRMRRMVDDLFMLARADAGEIELRRAPLYLDDLVAEVARNVRTLAEERGVSVALALAEESPFTGDDELLHRLVLNLLDNAIKYSPPGTAISLRLTRAAEGYRLEVSDTGPGIPLEVQPHLFERFVRADAARTRDESHPAGAGLGLSIARWIAEAHGGRLTLERSSAEGSTFVLVLPG